MNKLEEKIKDLITGTTLINTEIADYLIKKGLWNGTREAARCYIRRRRVKLAKETDTNTKIYGTKYHPNEVSFKKVNKLEKNSSTKYQTNTLIISDLHIPYENNKALEFCKYLQNKYSTTRTIFVGDILDNHAISSYTTSTKSKGSIKELDDSIEILQNWYKEFPEAFVCLGNHDTRVISKSDEIKLPVKWLKDYADVLQVPNWKFKDSWTFDDFTIIHGNDGKNIQAKLFKYKNKSIIQGHWHTESNISYYNEGLWSMQLGCLVDIDSYAFNYAKSNARQFILSAGVIYNGIPIIETLK